MLRRWAVVLLPGVLLYFLPLSGFTDPQRHLLGIFVATIIALVAQPVRMGVSVLLALTLLALTHTLPPAKVLSGFSNLTVWLVFTAFLFSRAFTQTGFGTRVGYLFILRFARSPLSLGYSIAAADLSLAPFIPSDTARGGGVIFPIARSVATDFGSEPGPTAGRMGAYLMLVAFHATYTASAMFLTGMAANPLIAEFALKIAHVNLTWGSWFAGAILPGMLSMIFVPWLISRLAGPEVRDTAPARELARRELKRMGPLQRQEKWLIAIMLCVMAGWVTSPWHGVSNTFVALAGLSAILLARVLTWEDLLAEQKAWDALIWFAVLVMMADQLNEIGVIKILSVKLFSLMGGISWPVLLVVLVASYCYIHYAFAGMTAHVTALYPGFLGAALAGGIPPMAAALPLAYFSNLNAAMTHYGTGSAPVYFGAGYVKQSDWWRIGFIISVVNFAIWMGVGMWWWRVVGIIQ
ncbi:MAG TPA: DASS family sodium-coupled anion symporter [Candidatus Sulfopaludibacter sp.]|jgi:DASS family divalent anion:Na+ symporter|nr:DASS family sodium-coupled anion symporter [Candidatus Sulfopaludibacter sp.]